VKRIKEKYKEFKLNDLSLTISGFAMHIVKNEGGVKDRYHLKYLLKETKGVNLLLKQQFYYILMIFLMIFFYYNINITT
jgi:hypothetical protein